MTITSSASANLIRTLAPAAVATRAEFSNRTQPWNAGFMLVARPSAAALVYGVNHPGTLAAATVRVRVSGAGGTAAFATSTGTVDGAATAGDDNVDTDIDVTTEIPVGAIVRFGAATTNYTVIAITSSNIQFTPVLAANVADNAIIKYGTAFSYAIPANSVTLPTTSDLTEANDYLNAIMIVYHDNTYTNGTIVPRYAAGALPVTGAFWSVTDASNFITSQAVGSDGLHVDWAVTDSLEIIVPLTASIVKIFDQATALAMPAYDIMAAGGSGKTGFVDINRIFV